MKKFNSKSFRWNIWGDRKRAPSPFPGRFPTRWNIIVKYRDFPGNKSPEKHWRYFGKPSQIIAKKLCKLLESKHGIAWVWESDKGGLLQHAVVNIPFGRMMAVQDWISHIAQAYYPNVYDEVVTSWARYNYERTKGNVNGKKFQAYSLPAALKDDNVKRRRPVSCPHCGFYQYRIGVKGQNYHLKCDDCGRRSEVTL